MQRNEHNTSKLKTVHRKDTWAAHGQLTLLSLQQISSNLDMGDGGVGWGAVWERRPQKAEMHMTHGAWSCSDVSCLELYHHIREPQGYDANTLPVSAHAMMGQA